MRLRASSACRSSARTASRRARAVCRRGNLAARLATVVVERPPGSPRGTGGGWGVRRAAHAIAGRNDPFDNADGEALAVGTGHEHWLFDHRGSAGGNEISGLARHLRLRRDAVRLPGSWHPLAAAITESWLRPSRPHRVRFLVLTNEVCMPERLRVLASQRTFSSVERKLKSEATR